MKKLLFLLLLAVSSYGQTLQNPTYGNTTTNTLKIKTPATVSTVNFLSTNEADGSVSKIEPVNVNIPYSPVNYSAPAQTIGNHLLGIDTRLGQISSTSAGLTQRVWFTADNTTVTAGTFFASNPLGKGAAATGSPSALVLGDNVKAYFNKDLISGAQPSATIGYAGTYSGNLTVSATPTPNATQQRFTLEVYRCNNGGTPIASGVSGAPVGDLGVTVVAILDSGLVNLVAGSISNVSISGTLTQNITINTGERLRYHVSAQKVGVGGGNVTFGVYYGSSYNSYYDVPVAITTDAVLNKSAVTGVTASDAINWLDANTLHKFGNETFTGIKSSTNTGATQINGLNLTNSGTSGSQVLFTSSTGGGRGAVFQSSGTSIAAAIENTGIGSGFYISNISTGRGATFDNVSTGALTILNSQTASTGDLLRFTKNGTTTLRVDSEGMIRGTNSGATSTIGIDLTNNGSNGTTSININNTSLGSGLRVSNSSTGIGYFLSNTGGGGGFYANNTSSGQGLNLNNTNIGTLIYMDSQTSSTGDLIQLRKNGVLTTKFDQNGLMSSTNTGSTQTTGISLTNNGTTVNGHSLKITNTSTGVGQYIDNQSTGNALYINNSSGGSAVNIQNASSGRSLYSLTSNSLGIGLESEVSAAGIAFNAINQSTGIGYQAMNNSTGRGFYSSSSSASGGNNFVANVATGSIATNFLGQNNGVTTFSVDRFGNIVGNTYSGGASLTGTPTAPTATAGTNTTQIATTAFVQAARPYKVITGIINQSSTSAPVLTIFENTTGETPTTAYNTVGIYSITFIQTLPTNKTFHMISVNNDTHYATSVLQSGATPKTVFVSMKRHVDNGYIDGLMINAPFEIRIYN
jgi:hypothetical protein